jgi:hypothetical protein
MTSGNDDFQSDGGVAGNQRLTALAGMVLMVLIVAEIVTVPILRALMTVHVVVGTILAGPLIIKFASTGYRFVRYYGRSAAYVRRGPPALPLRALAPLLVASTVVLVATGFGLMLTGPADAGALVALHNISFLVWLPLVALHTVAYVLRAVRLVQADVTEPTVSLPPGREWRFGGNGLALVLGAIGALLLLPDAPPWAAWIQVTETLPAPLIVGAVLTVVALVIAKPRRWT